MKRSVSGFTIVELLIVIVVIGILAAITVVAYNGIQNRANDSAVQSDLRNLRTKWMSFNAENGRYPQTTGEIVSAASGFRAAKGSYAIRPTTDHNLITCSNGPTFQKFSIAGYSKSGNRYYVTENLGVTAYTGSWADQDQVCAGTLTGWVAGDYRGYAAEDTTTGPWRPWAGGN